MGCVRAQKCRDVGGPGEQIESPGLDRLDKGRPNTQTLSDIGNAITECFALVAQQAANRSTRTGLAFNLRQSNWSGMKCSARPSWERSIRGPWTGQKRFDLSR